VRLSVRAIGSRINRSSDISFYIGRYAEDDFRFRAVRLHGHCGRADNDELTARRRIDALGLQQILDRIRAGETNRDIAKKLNIRPATLCRYLNEDAHAQQYDRAKADSAEALLDCGMEALEQARGGDATEVQRARAVAQEYARRAAIRNLRYSDKHALELTGPNGGPVQTQPQFVVYLPDNGRDKNSRLSGP
jgi:hypothetical protein